MDLAEAALQNDVGSRAFSSGGHPCLVWGMTVAGRGAEQLVTSICGDGGYRMRLLARARLVRPVWATVACACFLIAPALALAADQPGEPRNRLTVADNRRAKSVVVRRLDLLPSYRVDTTGTALPKIPRCAAYPGDRADITITGSARVGYTNGGSTIGSTALFFKNERNLEAYWRKTVRPEYATCFAEYYAKTRRAGVITETIEAAPIKIGPTGASRVAGFRTVTRLSAEGATPFDWYYTTVFVSTGRGLSIILVGSANAACECYTGLATDAVRRLRAAR
jgi:hypothetical protein